MTNESKTPEQIAAGLSVPMQTVLLRGADGQAEAATVFGNANTIFALMKRGLVHPDSRWTALGREVVRVLNPKIKTLDELHEMALAEDETLFPAPPAAPYTVEQYVDVAGRRFAVGDRVRAAEMNVPREGNAWRIDTIYVPADGIEPYAGLTAVDLAPKYGTRGTTLHFSQLVHADRTPVRTSAVEIITVSQPGPKQVEKLRRVVTDLAELHGVPVESLLPAADPATTDDTPELAERIVRRAQYDALRRMRIMVESWVAQQQEEHEANGHRREDVGQPCWNRWHPNDIRTMINDTARELGVPEMP